MSYDDSLARTQTQHNRHASHLLAAGWHLATSLPPPPSPQTFPPPTPSGSTTNDLNDCQPHQLPENIPDLSHHVHIILLSSSGVIFQQSDRVLSMLGLTALEVDTALKRLHYITITSLGTILKLRRKLERTSSTTLHQYSPLIPSTLSPPDPP